MTHSPLHDMQSFRGTGLVTTVTLVVAWLRMAGGNPRLASPVSCAMGVDKFWAIDGLNHECAEVCLSTEVQRVEFRIISGGHGARAGNETTPCADHGFHHFNRTDNLGAGPLKISLNIYSPDSSLPRDPSPKSKCALTCSAEAIGVYWTCAAVCIKELAPDSCITIGCLAATGAYDVNCLKGCKSSVAVEESTLIV